MYISKLVCAVKTNGKILREDQKDGSSAILTLPFGSEYSLLLKNLSGKRALVKIEIDGKNISEGGLVIDKGQQYEIERPVSSPNKFKFIEKTQEISDHRGDRIDDSLIRLTWQFEKAHVEYTSYTYSWPPKTRKKIIKRRPLKPFWYETEEWIEEEVEEIPWGGVYYNNTSGSMSGSCTGTVGNCNTTLTGGIETPDSSDLRCADLGIASGAVASSAPAKAFASGITVGGEKSSQQFSAASIGILENEVHSMVLQLRGIAGEKIVEKPVTVSSRIQCSSCGRSYKKSKYKFCPNDGTALD